MTFFSLGEYHLRRHTASDSCTISAQTGEIGGLTDPSLQFLNGEIAVDPTNPLEGHVYAFPEGTLLPKDTLAPESKIPLYLKEFIVSTKTEGKGGNTQMT